MIRITLDKHIEPPLVVDKRKIIALVPRLRESPFVFGVALGFDGEVLAMDVAYSVIRGQIGSFEGGQYPIQTVYVGRKYVANAIKERVSPRHLLDLHRGVNWAGLSLDNYASLATLFEKLRTS